MHPLTKWRTAMKMNQQELAEFISKKLRTTISQKTISNYESGATLPQVDIAERIEKLSKGAVSLGCWKKHKVSK